MRIQIESKGSFKNTEKFLRTMERGDIFRALDHYGLIGCVALAYATPIDSGLTAESWTFATSKKRNTYWIIWKNTNVVDGTPLAILLQYGHGTGTGGYVQGRDYINPAIKPVFDMIANEVWKVVRSA